MGDNAEWQAGVQDQLHGVRKQMLHEANAQTHRHDANKARIDVQDGKLEAVDERVKRLEKAVLDGNGQPALVVTVGKIETNLVVLTSWMKGIAAKLDVTDVATRDLKTQMWTAVKVLGSLAGLGLMIANYLKH